MRITYDPDADASFIYIKDDLSATEVASTHLCDEEGVKESAIILDLDEDGRLLRIEILGASKRLPREVLDMADPP